MRLGFAPIVALSAVMLALVGCRALRGNCHEPQAYSQAQDMPPLEIPAGLEAPDTSRALRIPELNEPRPPRRQSGPCLDEPPPYSTGQPEPPAA